MFTLKSLSPRTPHSCQVADLCNKTTMLYCVDAAQEGGRCPRLIFGCNYKEWFRHDYPSVEFGHYFASPIHITSTGPSTVSGILKASLLLK